MPCGCGASSRRWRPASPSVLSSKVQGPRSKDQGPRSKDQEPRTKDQGPKVQGPRSKVQDRGRCAPHPALLLLQTPKRSKQEKGFSPAEGITGAGIPVANRLPRILRRRRYVASHPRSRFPSTGAAGPPITPLSIRILRGFNSKSRIQNSTFPRRFSGVQFKIKNSKFNISPPDCPLSRPW
jgi:hypothetical protein